MSNCKRTLGIWLAAAVLGGLSGCTKDVRLEIGSVGETMTYDQKELVVPAGSRVTLVLKNNATTPAMVHNWVLVRPGSADQVGRDAITTTPAEGYIPETTAVLAHSALVKPGERGTVTFPAPPPGTYDFICTVPGHYVTMRGTLIVRR